MFSIPANINVNYPTTMPETPVGGINVGAAIKDMEPGAFTPTKLAHDQKVAAIREQFEINMREYHQQFETLTEAAGKASEAMPEARKNKIIAISALAVTIVATVGLLCAAAATGMLPLAFAAIPLLGLIGVESYFVHSTRTIVSGLKAQIEAPGRLPKPQLRLPVYEPSKDLDLRETRMDAQNVLSRMTLTQIASSGYSTTKIAKYALLDRAAKVSPESREVFYAQVNQLIDVLGEIKRKHDSYARQIANENSRLKNEFNAWAQVQRNSLASQKQLIVDRRRELGRQDEARAHGVPVRGNLFEKMHLEQAIADRKRQKNLFNETYRAKEVEIHNWYNNVFAVERNKFQEAISLVESRFNAAKAGAL